MISISHLICLQIKSYVQELIKMLGIDITLPEMKERDFDKLSQD
ncbi:hypothetical protein Bateq7PJ16_1933 [Bacillus subtilis]|nr:hypothetical protein Bateq7PJ16_1933 [Bacillus subtilis]RPJ97842.1 hypothetical protein EH11_04273 [Bacillus subtilis]RUS03520.1 hypothetical protein EFW59_04328 [Bacillus subtilis]CCU58358.1 hypothetical protein BSUBE1_1727 [Bacillus subtilis E1]